MSRVGLLAVVVLVALVAGGLLAWIARPTEVRFVQGEPPVSSNYDRSHDAPSSSSEQPVAPTPAPVSSAPQAAGVISGLVRWQDGRPCAGLALAIHKSVESPNHQWRELSPDERLARLKENAAVETEVVHSGVEGDFAFTGIGDGTYFVSSADRSYRLHPPRKAARAGDHLVFTVNRVFRVEFEFTLDTGERLQEAQLLFSGIGRTRNFPSRWSQGDSYTVFAGPCRLEVTGGPFNVWRAEHAFEVPEVGLNGPVPVTLRRRDALVVKLHEGEPSYASIGVHVLPAGMVPADLGRSFFELSFEVRSDVDQYKKPRVVTDLAAGSYSILCVVGGLEILARRDVDFRGGLHVEEIELKALELQDHLVVRVFDPEGAAVTQCNISAGVVGSGVSTHAVAIKGGGEYWIRRIDPALFRNLVQDATYSIRVWSTHGKRVVTCPYDHREPIEVRFGRKATLVVNLENRPPDPTDLVLLAYAAGTSASQAFSDRRSSGDAPMLLSRHEFELASGPVVIAVGRVSRNWWSAGEKVVLTMEIELPDTGAEITIDLSPLSHLRLRVPGAEDRTEVRLRGAEFSDHGYIAEGVLEFRYIPPGEYWIDMPVGAMLVRLPVQGEVVFQPQPYNALCVVRIDAGVLREEVGLRENDIIRQINGQPLLGTETELSSVFRAAGNQGRATLQIKRGAATVVLEATPEQWQEIKNYWLRGRCIAE